MTEAEKREVVAQIIKTMRDRGARVWDMGEILGRALVVTLTLLSTHNKRVRTVAAVTVGLIDALSKKPRQEITNARSAAL